MGLIGEQREQPVLQHFEFARQRMAGVDFDAAVIGGQRDRRGREVFKVEDRALKPGQQRRGRGFIITLVIEARIVYACLAAGLDQQAELRLRLLAPGGEQALAFLLIVGAAPRGKVGEATAIDDLEPVFAAGVQRVQMHLAALAERLQQREVHRRHRRQAEHVRHRGQRAGFDERGTA